jgi:mitofilin
LEKERMRVDFYSKVAESLGKIKGIEHALNARANLELQADNARELWLAVQNLNEILTSSVADNHMLASLTNPELAQIKTNISTIKKSAPDNEFVQKLIESMPSNALEQGVWTEPDLKERFANVKKVCGRVALIDERGGSLFKYFLSYVQSFFIINTKLPKTSEQTVPKLDEINLSTFNILNYAEHYLENNQFDLAIKLMQQLRGEPSRLAKDWIKDAITLLEIRQACNLLTSYISSVYIGSHTK